MGMASKFAYFVLFMFFVFPTESVSAKVLADGASVVKLSGNAAMVLPHQATTSSSFNATTAVPALYVSSTGPQATKPGAGMLGDLAAVVGLAWVASALGLGEVSAEVLFIGIPALACVFFLGWMFRTRTFGRVKTAARTNGLPKPTSSVHIAELSDYSVQNVGNDASARPWERSSMGFDASRFADSIRMVPKGSVPGSNLLGDPIVDLPDGFDRDAFLQTSKVNFMELQAAWDRADIPSLRAMMTDEMLAQITPQLTEREQHPSQTNNATEVVMLEARLLGMEVLAHAHVASVEFSGMIREDTSAGPSPFREIWGITRPKSGGGGWLVTEVQALT